MSQTPLKIAVDTCVYLDFLRDETGYSPSKLALETAYRHDGFVQSTRTVAELRLVLNYPNVAKLIDHQGRKSMLHAITSQADFVNVTDKDIAGVSELVAHRADQKFLALADKGHADCLLTRDRELLDLGDYKGIPIISPTRFLRTHEARHDHAPILRDAGFFLD